MTTREIIVQLEKLEQVILESGEWVFGDEKTDFQYVRALREAITILEKKEVEELKQ